MIRARLRSLLPVFLLSYTGAEAATVKFELPDSFPLRLPELVIDKKPALCARVLEVAKQAYLSIEPSPVVFEGADTEAYQGEDWHGLDGIKFEPVTIVTDEGSGTYWTYPFPEAVAENTYLLSSSGFQSSTNVQGFQILEREPDLPPAPIPETNSNYLRYIRSLPVEEGRLLPDIQFNSYTEIAPILFENEIYVVRGSSLQWDVVQELTVERITPSAVEQVCQTATVPQGKERNWRSAGLAEGINELSIFRDLMHSSELIAGEVYSFPFYYGPADQVLQRAILRPWTIPKEAWWTPRDWHDVDDILNTWKYQGIWEYRQYQDFKKLREKAEEQLTHYYERTLGWKYAPSSVLARNAMVLFTRALVERGDYLQSLRERDGMLSRPHWKLRCLLLERAHTTQIETLLETEADFDLNAENSVEGYYDDSYEPALFYALGDWSNVKLLLERGADVNATNHFGKTALMYAAHFDERASIKELLTHGADPNLKTQQKSDRRTAFHYVGRTALMYAVENASPTVVEFLLAAGADPTVTDQPANSYDQPRDMFDYLALNDKVDEAQREEIRAMLTRAIENRQ